MLRPFTPTCACAADGNDKAANAVKIAIRIVCSAQCPFIKNIIENIIINHCKNHYQKSHWREGPAQSAGP
jgi:hypothetical protein